MIKPTIGRVVLVYRNNSKTPQPALITHVWTNRMINVGGFDGNGVPFAETSLTLIQEGDTPLDPYTRYAEWMPYQVGQVAKTEALEAKLKEVSA